MSKANRDALSKKMQQKWKAERDKADARENLVHHHPERYPDALDELEQIVNNAKERIEK